MLRHVRVAVLLVVALSTSFAHAVKVERKRLTIEETSIERLSKALVRGLGYVLLVESPEGTDLAGLKQAVERLRIELESITVTLRDGGGKEQTFVLEKTAEMYQFKITASAAGFDPKTVHHVSQQSLFWVTVRGYRVHLREEVEYNPGGFVQLDLRVLNSVGRVTSAGFTVDLYEKDVDQRTRIETTLAVSARVPGRPCGIIHRVARRIIARKADDALCTLDRKVREIATRDKGDLLELVSALALRAAAGLR
ncbi:MAG: hypothetical protein ACYTG0_18855 [Planctomycetota bacterium]|jgi:hypothetical protein